MVQVTITYYNGSLATKTMSQDEAMQLVLQKNNGELPEIVDIEVKLDSA